MDNSTAKATALQLKLKVQKSNDTRERGGEGVGGGEREREREREYSLIEKHNIRDPDVVWLDSNGPYFTVLRWVPFQLVVFPVLHANTHKNHIRKAVLQDFKYEDIV